MIPCLRNQVSLTGIRLHETKSLVYCGKLSIAAPVDTKKFWKSVRYIDKKQSSIPVLQCNEVSYETDEQKASILSSFFSSCFNQSHPPHDPSSHPFDQLHQFSSEDMDCTVEEVRGALKRLNITKASGPDHISARMLKYTANSNFKKDILSCPTNSIWRFCGHI